MTQEDEREFLAARKSLTERGMEVSVLIPNERLRVWKEEGDTLEMNRLASRWTVVRWDCVPGPGPDDFHAEYATLDEALLSIWNFFFGQPIVIGDWVVPIHRRPFWTLGRLQYRLANLVHVSQSAFDAIAEQRRLRARTSPKKEPGFAYQAEVSQFLRCDHVSGSVLRLMVRRDLEEAYVVDAGSVADCEERDETHE